MKVGYLDCSIKVLSKDKILILYTNNQESHIVICKILKTDIQILTDTISDKTISSITMLTENKMFITRMTSTELCARIGYINEDNTITLQETEVVIENIYTPNELLSVQIVSNDKIAVFYNIYSSNASQRYNLYCQVCVISNTDKINVYSGGKITANQVYGNLKFIPLSGNYILVTYFDQNYILYGFVYAIDDVGKLTCRNFNKNE